MSKRTLFVSFEAGKWTESQLDRLIDTLGDATPDDVEVVAAPDSVEYLTAEEAETYLRSIFEVVAEDD